MFRHLVLTRPLAVIDLETTGINPQTDRIVEISVLRLAPREERVHKTRRINPEMPIPPAATAIHKITDADVAAEPTFAVLARGLLDFLEGCDLCGFNLKKFDLRMLHAEFQRAGMTLPLEDRAIIDPMEIFHAYEKRTLEAAVQFYLAREHAGAHGAEADVLATAEVLDAMLARYGDLPREVASLHRQFGPAGGVDSDNFFTKVESEIRFAKGKHRGQPLDAIAKRDADYLRWMLGKDLFPDTKAVVAAALERVSQTTGG